MKTIIKVLKVILGVFGILIALNGVLRMPQIFYSFNASSYNLGYGFGTLIAIAIGCYLAYWGIFKKNKPETL